MRRLREKIIYADLPYKRRLAGHITEKTAASPSASCCLSIIQ